MRTTEDETNAGAGQAAPTLPGPPPAVLAHVHAELAAPAAAVLGLALSLAESAEASDVAEPLCADVDALAQAARRLGQAVEGLLVPSPERSAPLVDAVVLRAALRHELHTPLEAVRGYAELLLDQGDELDGEWSRPRLTRLRAACERLQWAIDAVTRFATEPVCMAAIVGEAGPAATVGGILVVDADRDGRMLLERRLRAAGHSVHLAADETQALAMLPLPGLDIILLNLGPSPEDGVDLLCRLKGRTALRDVPVVAFGAPDLGATAARCIEAGAEDCLARPVDARLLAARIATVLDRKRQRDIERAHLERLQWELTMARRLQGSVLPRGFPAVPGLEGHGLTVPAREVGGDFFDFIPLGGDRVAIALGDVSGKGVPAAYLMGIVRGMLRVAASLGTPPADCLARLDRFLGAANDHAMFATVVYGILDAERATLTYANAGHGPPLLLGADGEARVLPPHAGPALAAFGDGRYADIEVPLAPGDVVLLYTDGIVEALAPDATAFGIERLLARARRLSAASPQELCEGLVEEVRVYAAGHPLLDDIACAAVRFGGRGGARRQPAVAVELAVAPTPDEVRRLTRIAASFCLGHRLPDRIANHVCLALDEAVTNVISHGRPHGAASQDIRVRLELRGDVLRIEIRDRCRAFDPLSQARPLQEPAAEDIPVGGLGIHIMRSMVDSVEYERAGDENRLILVKRVAGGARGT